MPEDRITAMATIPSSDVNAPRDASLTQRRAGILYPASGLHHCPFCGTPAEALWELNYDTGMLRVGERLLRLTPIEADILAALASPPGRVLSTDRLIMRVWGGAEPASADHALWVHIFTLRRRLRAGGASGALAIASLRGRGYVLLQERYEPVGKEQTPEDGRQMTDDR